MPVLTREVEVERLLQLRCAEMAGLLRSPHSSPSKKDLEDVGLSCEVCMEAYSLPPSLKIPKALHCLHTFCLECCSKLLQPAANGSAEHEIECPSCRKTTRLQEGLESLMNNFALLRVLDMISLNNAVEPLDGEESSVCEECTAAASAAHYCAECGEFLCTDCAGIHRRMRATAEHQVMGLAQLKAEGGLSALRGRRVMCRNHPREELKLWCETCKELVCRDCTIIDHARPEHTYGFAMEAGEQHRAALRSRVEGLKGRMAWARRAVSELQKAQQHALRRDTRAMEGLRARFKEIFEAVRAREAEVLEEAEAHVTTTRDAIAAQEQLLQLFLRSGEQCCSFIDKATESASTLELLGASTHMLARLAEVEQEQSCLQTAPPTDEALSFADDLAPLLSAIKACASRQRSTACTAIVPRALGHSASASSLTSDDADPDLPPPLGGVQYGLSLQELLQQGWQVQYHQPYSHPTSLADLDPGRGEWLLVGARKRGHDELILAAAARREDVLRRTKGGSDVHESNGTFWYCWEGKAFGFAGSLKVTLSAADTEHSFPESRLSWHINGGGGWRAGRETHLGEDVGRSDARDCKSTARD